jgi:hypothetical protein
MMVALLPVQRCPAMPGLMQHSRGGSARHVGLGLLVLVDTDQPRRRVYDRSHACAATRAGVSTFDLVRYMGTSVTVINRHCDDLAEDAHHL